MMHISELLKISEGYPQQEEQRYWERLEKSIV